MTQSLKLEQSLWQSVGVKIKAGRVLGKSWPGREAPLLLLPVPCGAMTVIGVSILPHKEVTMEQNFR